MTDEARLVVQLALGVVFLLSDTAKLRNPMTFAFGLLLMPGEVFLALSHLTGWLIVVGVPLAMVTLVSFAVAVGVNLLRRREVPCYCFGDGRETISGRSLTRLLMMTSGEVVLVTDSGFFGGSWSRSAPVATAKDIGLGLTWILLVLLASMWALSLPDLVDLLSRHSCKTCPDSIEASVQGVS